MKVYFIKHHQNT